MKHRLASVISVFLVAVANVTLAQQAAPVNLVPPHDSLLPPVFGTWTISAAPPPAVPIEPSMSLLTANKQALEEDQPKRSQVVVYTGPGGKQLHVEAVEFPDYTGAWSAYTLIRKPGLKDSKDIGTVDAFGENTVLFISGATLVVAYPVTAPDVKALAPLAGSLPPVHGSSAQPPSLPTFLPAAGLVPGSVRYAIGPATYAAQGGALPANSVGWDKSAEAITARYKDKRGDETLTLLIYPTPQIAAAHLRSAQSLFSGMGPSFATAKARRDLELVMVVNGTYSATDAQHMVDNIHMKQIASVDTDIQPTVHQQVNQAASMLLNIGILSGFLCGAAVLLGLFFGGGRALVRILQGKPAATEVEFLSLHLANQNAPVIFSGQATAEGPTDGPTNTQETRQKPE